ncbi:hypothetical protein EZV62_006663 [Acer yangbiense]|uniref:Uncharacterized protein n=1 Tax=Acer yangbiense TaxID=1000413 RepID=A0A5C7I8I5_9ROSI|nr:hypothetical protein EZV62_006663 [Acer yangbiense]
MLFSSVRPTATQSLLPDHSTCLPAICLPFSPSTKSTLKPLRPSRLLRIRAPENPQHHLQSTSLKIAIIGFGNFGQFLAKALVRHNHLLHSRSDYSHIAGQLNATFYHDIHDLCEQRPDVVLISTSILSTEKFIKSIPYPRLKRSTLFIDVLSSGKDSWLGIPFVYDKVRLRDNDEDRVTRVERFLDISAKEGCRMVEMSCAEHDMYAARSQLVTHTIGRLLERFGVESTSINTKEYQTLLDLVQNTKGDSIELYYGLFMYNKNSLDQLERLDMAFQAIKKELLRQFYDRKLYNATFH